MRRSTRPDPHDARRQPAPAGDADRVEPGAADRRHGRRGRLPRPARGRRQRRGRAAGRPGDRRPERRRARALDGLADRLRRLVDVRVRAARRNRARRRRAVRAAGPPLGAGRPAAHQLRRPARPGAVRRRVRRPVVRRHDGPPGGEVPRGARAADVRRAGRRPARHRERHRRRWRRPASRRASSTRWRRAAAPASPTTTTATRTPSSRPARRRCGRSTSRDRGRRADPAARRPVHRGELGPDQPRAERRRTTGGSR